MVAYGSALSRVGSEESALSELDGEKTVPYSQQQRMRPWEWKDIRFGMGGYITLAHILAIWGIFYVPDCKASTLLWAAALWPIAGIGITGGAHRLWSHRSYTAGPTYRFFMMLANLLVQSDL